VPDATIGNPFAGTAILFAVLAVLRPVADVVPTPFLGALAVVRTAIAVLAGATLFVTAYGFIHRADLT